MLKDLLKAFNKYIHKNKHSNKNYLTLALVIIAVVIAILGFLMLKDAMFPLILSALWAFIIKFVKSSLKNYFFD
jgi:predicted PurR-regulated permease PerM